METEPHPARVLTWTDAVKTVLLPPAGLFWLAFAGLALLATRFAAAGAAVAGLGVAALYALALPAVGRGLLARLDRYPPFDPERFAAASPTALVVLDAGRRSGAREFGGDGLKAMTLERLAYAAWLWRRLRLPVAVSGDGAGPLMATFLDEMFAVPVRWVEPASHTTHENAVETARLLRRDGVGRLVLVTHFWHMPRAVAAFAATGLEVIPAPIDFGRRRSSWETGLLALVPSSAALLRSYLAIHEIVGLAWYRWRHGHR